MQEWASINMGRVDAMTIMASTKRGSLKLMPSNQLKLDSRGRRQKWRIK
jgi:hypothetical protein